MVVHGNGGAAALAAAIVVGARKNRFTQPELFQVKSPVTAITGTLMLYWAWFGYTGGASLDVEGGMELNAKIAVNTLQGSVGGKDSNLANEFQHIIADFCLYLGALSATFASYVLNRYKMDIDDFIFGILGGLVSVTGSCAVCTAGESLCIGLVAGFLCIASKRLLVKMHVDDAVGAVATHFVCGVFGTLVVGLFGRGRLPDSEDLNLLRVQCYGILAIATWSFCSTVLFLSILRFTTGIRMADDDVVGRTLYEVSARTTGDVLSKNWSDAKRICGADGGKSG